MREIGEALPQEQGMEKAAGGTEAPTAEPLAAATIEEMLETALPVEPSPLDEFFSNGHDVARHEPAPEFGTAAPTEAEAETPAEEPENIASKDVEIPGNEAEGIEKKAVEMQGVELEGAEEETLEMPQSEAGADAQGEEQPAFQPETETGEEPAASPELAPLQGLGVDDRIGEEILAPPPTPPEAGEMPLEIADNLATPSPDETIATEAAVPIAIGMPVEPAKEMPLVFITGASSGIGKATAEIFAKNGYRLLLAARREERLEEIKTDLQATWNASVHLLNLDVRNLQAVKDAMENLPEDLKNVDILINNAGLARGLAPIHEGDIEHWEQMIDTNIKGLLYLTRVISPHMVARRQGHIINIGSAAGKEVYPMGNVYCATKFAVDALTNAMRLDLFQHGVRVSQVSPGAVEDTEFSLVRYDGDEERAARTYEDFQPLRASDVAEVIYFMATRPAHVNVQDVLIYCSQQGSTRDLDRSGR